MHPSFSTLATGVALALGSSVVSAADINDIFSVRGYGTLGAVYSSQDQADYVRDMYSQPEGAGRTHSVSTDVDSKSAIQLDMKFTDRFSAVIQVVSEAMYNNSWDNDPQKMWMPSLEWANVSYRVTDNLTVRAGRIVMPFLMNSEFQKVGYANHWMRAPAELYGDLSYTSLDGGDVWYTHSLGSGKNTIRLYAGEQEAQRDPYSFKATMSGIIDTYEIGSLTVRAAYQYTTLPSSMDLVTTFQQLSAGFAMMHATAAVEKANSLAAELSHDYRIEFATVGVSYDPGQWFMMGEVFKGTGTALVPKHISAYASGGARISNWTPYATIARTDVKASTDLIPTAGLLGPLLIGAQQLNDGFASQSAYSQTTLSLGMRWEAYKNIAVKAQYDHVALPDDSHGMFVNRSADFKNGQGANVLGLSVDFVF